MNYYSEIKNELINNEITKKVKDYSKNKSDLTTYYNVGKLLSEAGKHYGEGIISEYSKRLTVEIGKGYGLSNLKRMRQFYWLIEKGVAMPHQLSWSHILVLLPLKNKNEMNYYINQVILNHLSTRELRSMIKSKAYDRLSYVDKEKIELIDNHAILSIEDMIKEPILIKIDKQVSKLDEKALHKYIIYMLEDRFLELGTGFALVGHEYKIKINNHIFRIDLLFFNINLNSYIVIELKTREFKPQDIGQLELYVNYIDNNIKLSNHNKTIGILIVKKKDKYVIEYVTNKEVFITTYKLV